MSEEQALREEVVATARAMNPAVICRWPSSISGPIVVAASAVDGCGSEPAVEMLAAEPLGARGRSGFVILAEGVRRSSNMT